LPDRRHERDHRGLVAPPIWKKEIYAESDPAWKANKEFFEAHNVN